MAQFRTTADIVDNSLRNAGEVTNGNSPYESEALAFINRVHFSLISGGTIPLGKDTTVTIDETWVWSKAKGPLILELLPKYDTGTVSLTLGSEVGAFSDAPAISLQGYHLQVSGRQEWLKIAQHTSGATAFEFDGAYPDATGATLSFVAVKLDYQLVPSYVIVNTSNDKIEFQESAGVTLTGTLTQGTYTPSDLITHVVAVLNATGGTPVYTGSYSAITGKYTISSDRAGGAVFVLVGTGTYAAQSVHKTLGFDDENTTNAASVTSTYVRGAIARLVEPFRVHKGGADGIFSLDTESFSRDYPTSSIEEGVPDRFCVIAENGDGIYTVRFNRYPLEKTRVEIEHVPVPRDLKDNSSSIPLVPRKHIDILEDAATFRIMLLKSDDRAQTYSQLVQGTLLSMVSQHRGSLLRSGENFGQIISRRDMVSGKRKLFPSEPY